MDLDGDRNQALKPSYLELDPLDEENLRRASEMSQTIAHPRYLSEDSRSYRVTPSRTKLERSRARHQFAEPTEIFRNLFQSIPDRFHRIDIQQPLEVPAREITNHLHGIPSNELDFRIKHDLDALNMKFFVLHVNFGIDPDPKELVDSVSVKAVLKPGMHSGGCIRIYAQAPQTSFEKTAEYNGKTEVTSQMGFQIPKRLVPWLNAGIDIKAQAIYEEHLAFSKAIVTSTTNSNDNMSWQFKRSAETGEDPRGTYRLCATVGIPRDFAENVQELKGLIQADLAIKADVKGWLFTNRGRSTSLDVVFT